MNLMREYVGVITYKNNALHLVVYVYMHMSVRPVICALCENNHRHERNKCEQ